MSESVINEILVGAAGDGSGGLLSTMVLWAGGRMVERFRPTEKQQALRVALETGLLGAFEAVEDDASNLSKYYLECMADFLRQEIVQRELGVLLTPYETFDYEVLSTEFERVTQGYPPEKIPDIDLSAFINALERDFYEAVLDDTELRDVIKVVRLDALAEFASQNLLANENTAQNTEQIYELFRRFIESISKSNHANEPIPRFVLETLEEFKLYHHLLHEWKELHNHLNSVLMIIPQFSLEVERMSKAQPSRVEIIGLNRSWKPIWTKIQRMLEWAENIQHIGVKYEEFANGDLKGEKWAVTLSVRAQRISEMLKRQPLDSQLEDTVDSLRHEVNEFMYLADTRLRTTATELYSLSRVALGSIKR